ncbi:MAG: hypothetical protein L0Y75_05840 [Acidobacteria bacterium]|nr:hypothetical protein [Acidobacteriota bacterium]
MPQAEPFYVDFPPQPTPGEFMVTVSVLWLIGLILIAAGAYGLNRMNNVWAGVLTIIALALGFGACFLLGFHFMPFHHHHVIVWAPDDPNINDWIGLCLGLMVWGTSFLFFWDCRKIGKRRVKPTEPNAN